MACFLAPIQNCREVTKRLVGPARPRAGIGIEPLGNLRRRNPCNLPRTKGGQKLRVQIVPQRGKRGGGIDPALGIQECGAERPKGERVALLWSRGPLSCSFVRMEGFARFADVHVLKTPQGDTPGLPGVPLPADPGLGAAGLDPQGQAFALRVMKHVFLLARLER